MLQFKMGTYAGLKALDAPTSAGTVYVTTDEQAMYVDIPKGEGFARVRMGDVIQVKDVAELQSFAPDYNTNALYYVIDKNALMKYTGDGSTHSWKQINSVEAVDTLIKEVGEKVDELEIVINANTTAIGTAAKDGKPGTGLIGRAETLEAADEAIKDRLDVVEPKVETLEDKVGSKAEGDTSEATLFERVAANKAAAEAAQSKADTNETNIANLTKTVNTNVTDIAGLKQADTAMTGRVDGIEDRVEANETAIGSKVADDKSTKSLYARVYDNEVAAAAAQTTADANELAIGELSGVVGDSTKGLVKAVADLQTADTNMGTRVDGIEDRVEANETAIGEKATGDTNTKSLYARAYDNQVAAKNAQDKADANELAISALNGVVGDEKEGLVKDVADLKAADVTINAALGTKADSADSQGTAFARIASVANKVGTAEDGASATGSVYARIKQNVADIDAVEKGVSDNALAIAGVKTTAEGAAAQAATNKTDIAGLTTRIGNAEGAATALTTRVATAEGEIDALQETVKGISANAVDIANINKKLAGIGENETVVDKIEALGEDLSAEIVEKINAANAMNYISGINEYANLPTAEVKAGDTYVVLTGFNQTINGESVRFDAGDLLVAAGTEDKTTGFITSGLEWNHVKTGYVAAHEATLAGEDNKIKLTSHLGTQLGQVEFVSANENLKVSVTGNKVTLGFEWGTF
jgi:predicted  nucleic acid-binding Zn-ribbon protein